MARIRTIKPEFPQSQSMGRVSRDARLLFVLLWTVVDDSGRTRGNSRMLASLLFPYDDDAPIEINRWIAELEAEECIIRYEVGGNDYLEICKWRDHQKIDRPTPSRLPSPREGSRIFAKPRESSSGDLDLDLDLDRDQGPGSGPSSCVETEKSVSTPAERRNDRAPVNGNGVLDFPCDGMPQVWHLTEAQVRDWAGLYPAIDVMAECRAALAWVLASPDRRKTARGMSRFLVGWLGRATNGRRAAAPSNDPRGTFAAGQSFLERSGSDDFLERVRAASEHHAGRGDAV